MDSLSLLAEFIRTFLDSLTSETIAAVIAGTPSAVLAAIVSFQTIRNNKAKAINEFLSAMEKKDFIKSRHYVYNYKHNGEINIEDTDINVVINFFQHWGLLTRMKYLPKEIFNTGSGAGVIRLYEKLKIYIDAYRKHTNDPTYANEFEWLYNEVIKLKNK